MPVFRLIEWGSIVAAPAEIIELVERFQLEGKNCRITDVDAFVDARIAQQISSLNSRWFRHFIDYDPRIALSILDPDNAGRYLEIRGTAEVAPDDDRSFATEMGRKYLGVDEYPYDEPGAKRVIVTVHAQKVSSLASSPMRR